MLHAALSLAVLLCAAPAPKRTGHPAVEAHGPPDACVTCHAERTPDVVKQWDAGPHGAALVKCYACHGSTGEDFVRAPRARRCEGCHPAEYASVGVARGASASVCFGCHSPHALGAAGRQNPHAGRR